MQDTRRNRRRFSAAPRVPLNCLGLRAARSSICVVRNSVVIEHGVQRRAQLVRPSPEIRPSACLRSPLSARCLHRRQPPLSMATAACAASPVTMRSPASVNVALRGRKTAAKDLAGPADHRTRGAAPGGVLVECRDAAHSAVIVDRGRHRRCRAVRRGRSGE